MLIKHVGAPISAVLEPPGLEGEETLAIWVMSKAAASDFASFLPSNVAAAGGTDAGWLSKGSPLSYLTGIVSVVYENEHCLALCPQVS